MKNRLKLLVVAPSAPPKRSPEAIQVRRILGELDRVASGCVLTTDMPVKGGWVRLDSSLELPLQHFSYRSLRPPVPNALWRVLSSHRLRRLHYPDAERWLLWQTNRIMRMVTQTPDLIYSRSYPLSAALLACQLKKRFRVPWIMHLSDPWADNPYRTADPRDWELERRCIDHADGLSVTTQSQLALYRQRYPHRADIMFVTPNVMMQNDEQQAITISHPSGEAPLKLVYTGAFYGDRSARTLVKALQMLADNAPQLASQCVVEVYGNANADEQALLRSAPTMLRYHGPVAFSQAMQAQASADVLISIEALATHPFHTTFLPSKMVDYLALQKRVLALTPSSSETEALCRQGYGWAVEPNDADALYARLKELIANRQQWRSEAPLPPPEAYRPEVAVQTLWQHMQRLIREAAQ